MPLSNCQLRMGNMGLLQLEHFTALFVPLLTCTLLSLACILLCLRFLTSLGSRTHHAGAGSNRELLIKYALGIGISGQIGTEGALLLANQLVCFFQLPTPMETALSVCSQLLFLYCPLLLCMSLFFPKLTKNRVANVAALSCLGWTICGLEIQSNNFFLLIIQSHLPTWAAIVTGLTLIDCYFRLKPKPVPMLVNQCMNADNLSLEEMLDAAPFFILVALCIVLCAIKVYNNLRTPITRQADNANDSVVPSMSIEIQRLDIADLYNNGNNNLIIINHQVHAVPSSSTQRQQPTMPIEANSTNNILALLFLLLSNFSFKLLLTPGKKPTIYGQNHFQTHHHQQHLHHRHRRQCRMFLQFLPIALLDAAIRMAAHKLSEGYHDSTPYRRTRIQANPVVQRPSSNATFSDASSSSSIITKNFDPELFSVLFHSAHFLLLSIGFCVCLLAGYPKFRMAIHIRFRKMHRFLCCRINGGGGANNGTAGNESQIYNDWPTGPFYVE